MHIKEIKKTEIKKRNKKTQKIMLCPRLADVVIKTNYIQVKNALSQYKSK